MQAILNGRTHEAKPVAPPMRLWVGCEAFLAAALVATVCIQGFVVMPALRETSASLRAVDAAQRQRDADDAERAQRQEAARRLLIRQQAEMLVQQQEALRLAKELKTTLRGN